MPYYSKAELEQLNFKFIGKNVQISTKASIYNSENIEIDNNSRIDDFCILSGNIKIGKNVHITSMCLLAGGEKGIVLEDFTTLAYGVKVFTQSDDYSGETMTNSTIPVGYKNEYKKEVVIKMYSILGAGSIVLPGVILAEGTSVGAMSLMHKNTEPWGIYIGTPAKRLRNRSKNLLKLKVQYQNEMGYN